MWLQHATHFSERLRQISLVKNIEQAVLRGHTNAVVGNGKVQRISTTQVDEIAFQPCVFTLRHLQIFGTGGDHFINHVKANHGPSATAEVRTLQQLYAAANADVKHRRRATRSRGCTVLPQP